MAPPSQTREKVLIEITGVLRNLSVVKKYQRDFGGAVLDALSALLFRFTMNGTLMLNVARILSKLSLHQFCRAALSAYAPNIEMLLQLLAIHDTNLALAVRVCFVLGNLTVSNDENRRRIGLDFSGACARVWCQRWLRDEGQSVRAIARISIAVHFSPSVTKIQFRVIIR